MEEGAPRPVPGERTINRVSARQSRRLKVGFATAVFARSMGMEDAPAAGESEDGLVYLSASPFYAMMRRLAQARWRRARRMAAMEKRTEPRMRAWKRRWPGEGKALTARLSSLAVDRLVLAQPQNQAAPKQVVVQEEPKVAAPRKLTVRRRSDAQALLKLLKGSRHGVAAINELLEDLLPELAQQDQVEVRRAVARVARQEAVRTSVRRAENTPIVAPLLAAPAEKVAPVRAVAAAKAVTPAASSEAAAPVVRAAATAPGTPVVARVSSAGPVSPAASSSSAAPASPVRRVVSGPVSTASATATPEESWVEEAEEAVVTPRRRPLERVGSRLERAAASASPVARALEQTLPPQFSRYTAELAEVLVAENPARVARVLRKLSVAPAAVVQEALEQLEGPAPLRAASRIAPVEGSKKRTGGLRSLSVSSPMMAMMSAPPAAAPVVAEERPSLVQRPVARATKAMRNRVEAASPVRVSRAAAPQVSRVPLAAPAQTVAAAPPVQAAPARTVAPSVSSEIGPSARPSTRSALLPSPAVAAPVPGASPVARAESSGSEPSPRSPAALRPQSVAVSPEGSPVVSPSLPVASRPSEVVAEMEEALVPSLPATARAALRAEAPVVRFVRAAPALREGRFVAVQSEDATETAEAPMMHAASRASSTEGARSVMPRRSRGSAPSTVLPTPIGAEPVSSETATGTPVSTTPKAAKVRSEARAARATSVHATERLNRVSTASLSAATLLTPVKAAERSERVSVAEVGTPAAAARANRAAAPTARSSAGVSATPLLSRPASVETERTLRSEPGRTETGRTETARPVVARSEVLRTEARVDQLAEQSETEAPKTTSRPRHLARSLTRAMPFASRSAMPGMKTAVEAALSGAIPELEQLFAAEPALRTEVAAAVARGEIPAAVSVVAALANTRLAGVEPGRARRMAPATPGVLAAPPVTTPGTIPAEAAPSSPARTSARAAQPARMAETRIPSDPVLVRELISLVERAAQPTFLPLSTGASAEQPSVVRRGALAAAVERHASPALRQSLGARTLDALEAALQPLRSRKSNTASPGPLFFAGTSEAGPAAESAAPVANAAGRYVAARSLLGVSSVRVVRDAVGRLMTVPATEAGESTRVARGARFVRGMPATDVVLAFRAAEAPTEVQVVGRPVNWAMRRSAVQEAAGFSPGRASTPAAFMAMGDARVLRAPGAPRLLSASTEEEGTPVSARAEQRSQRTGAARRTAQTADLGNTLHTVANGGTAAPGWAARASEESTGIRTVDSLVHALARATSVEEVVRVITERSEGRQETPTVLPTVFNEVAQQLRVEARAEVEKALTSAPTSRPTRMVAPVAEPLRPAASARNFRHGGRSAAASAISTQGAGASRVMKLVQKLQGLIHLAEEERRLSDARRRVRMAEDSASARAEVQAPLGKGQDPAKQRELDIEALGREVTEIVTREIEHRRSRRMEDSDEFWW